MAEVALPVCLMSSAPLCRTSSGEGCTQEGSTSPRMSTGPMTPLGIAPCGPPLGSSFRSRVPGDTPQGVYLSLSHLRLRTFSLILSS